MSERVSSDHRQNGLPFNSLNEATLIERQEIVNEFSIFHSPLVGQLEKLHYISISIYNYVIYICIYISMSILYEYLYTLSTSLLCSHCLQKPLNIFIIAI